MDDWQDGRKKGKPTAKSLLAQADFGLPRGTAKPRGTRASVSDLLGKLRIEQHRHQVNLAAKGVAEYPSSSGEKGKGKAIHQESGLDLPSLDVPELSVSAIGPASSRSVGPSGRRTPGPAAPASWRSPGSASGTRTVNRPSLPQHRPAQPLNGLWNEIVLPNYLSSDLRPLVESDEEQEEGTGRGRGACSLVLLCLRIISQLLDSPAPHSDPIEKQEAIEELAWLRREVKLLRREFRVVTMTEGIAGGWIGLEGIRALYEGTPVVLEVDDDKDWDEESTEDLEDEKALPLPILDLSSVINLQLQPKFLKPIKSLLRTPFSTSLRSLNLSGLGLTHCEVISLIPLDMLQILTHLSLAGLVVGKESELLRACGMLVRSAKALEFLDLSFLVGPYSEPIVLRHLLDKLAMPSLRELGIVPKKDRQAGLDPQSVLKDYNETRVKSELPWITLHL